MEQKLTERTPDRRSQTSRENGKAGGRPSTGRKRFVAYVTDSEREDILRVIPRLADQKTKPQ